jgi:alkenylglycerophosphocholine hydrolase
MIPGLIIILAVAVVDWVAVARGWRKVELIAKPATLVALFLFLLSGLVVIGFGSLPLIFFGVGLLFCLAGDIFLMLSDRWFLPGLAAFLLGHVAYIIGFNLPLPDVSPVWSIGIAIILAITAGRVLRRILIGLKAKGLQRMAGPVVLYGIVITVMLLSALLTLFRLDWNRWAGLLAFIGAFLFYLSDVILALNKFVAPIKNGRLANMIAYHLGQIALITGVFLQFVK